MSSSYMLLVVEKPNDRRDRSAGEGQDRMNRMVRWGENLKARGVLEASNSLRSHAEAVRVQVQDGRRNLLDGPFAEAKEMIGGYFLLNCASRDEAIGIAGECPAAQWATIEVREIGTCAD
jgi:hypothetical protein